jgi:16S rRNA (guanine966-N2)-methyltransferase
MLGDISGLFVLDLFCGTGALGIEALSRGAGEVNFVDKKTGAVMRNLEDLGVVDGRYGWQVYKRDVLDFLEARAIFESNRRADLVLCDPPYRLADTLALGLGITIPGVVEEGARLVIETATRKPLSMSFPLIKERAYGDTLLRIYSVPALKAGEEEA